MLTKSRIITAERSIYGVRNDHTFIGSIITRDGYDHKEINSRFSVGRMAVTKLEKIMKDRDV